MKLKTLDQIHISSVKADSLRPGEEFEVSDAAGKELMKQRPNTFLRLDAGDEPSSKAEEASPKNKAEPAAPANKAMSGLKAKSEAE